MFAAAPSIGIVTASGHFTLDRSQVWGNATLFRGAKIETDAASSEAVLENGVRVQLGAKSAASLLDSRMTLWKGVSQVSGSPAFEVDAGGLAVHLADAGSHVRVAWAKDGMVEVAALTGAARVAAANGAELARIPAGRTMSFALQQGGTVMRTGCLVSKDGRYLIQDQATQEVVEVTGPNLAQSVGNRVTATGTASTARPTVTGATSVLNAMSIMVVQQGGCLSVAAALNASTEPTGTVAGGGQPPAQAPSQGPAAPAGSSAPKTGMSTGAKIAIVGVVAGGGAGAAIALAGGKKSTSQ